jgi:hypothetical protein
MSDMWLHNKIFSLSSNKELYTKIVDLCSTYALEGGGILWIKYANNQDNSPGFHFAQFSSDDFLFTFLRENYDGYENLVKDYNSLTHYCMFISIPTENSFAQYTGQNALFTDKSGNNFQGKLSANSSESNFIKGKLLKIEYQLTV